MTKKRGGAQPGAGRPKGSLGGHTIQAMRAKEYVVARVTENLPALLDVMLAKGMGGDIQAIKDLLDRAYGRPTESIEHGGGIQVTTLRMDI